jgi:methyl-accepting chemotaxis protein
MLRCRGRRALISESSEKVRHGAQIVGEFGKALGDIGGGVERLTHAMAEIATASQQQACGIDQVNRAIAQMDEMTQQNAALSEQATAASQSIVQQVKQLTGLVARYHREARPVETGVRGGSEHFSTPRRLSG